MHIEQEGEKPLASNTLISSHSHVLGSTSRINWANPCMPRWHRGTRCAKVYDTACLDTLRSIQLSQSYIHKQGCGERISRTRRTRMLRRVEKDDGGEAANLWRIWSRFGEMKWGRRNNRCPNYVGCLPSQPSRAQLRKHGCNPVLLCWQPKDSPLSNLHTSLPTSSTPLLPENPSQVSRLCGDISSPLQHQVPSACLLVFSTCICFC